jgi:hypothetical protein
MVSLPEPALTSHLGDALNGPKWNGSEWRTLRATIQDALGIDPEKEIITPVGRPIALSDGVPIRELMEAS